MERINPNQPKKVIIMTIAESVSGLPITVVALIDNGITPTQRQGEMIEQAMGTRIICAQAANHNMVAEFKKVNGNGIRVSLTYTACGTLARTVDIGPRGQITTDDFLPDYYK